MGSDNKLLKRIAWAVAAMAVLVVAAALRLHDFFNAGVWDALSDEARIALGASSIVRYKCLIFSYMSGHEPPLSLWLTAPFAAAFGRELWAARLAPLVFNLVAITFIYLAGRNFFSRAGGLAAASAAALIPFCIYYSRTLYESSFTPFFSAAVLYFHSEFVKTGRKRLLYAEAAALGLGLSTNLVFIYFSAALLVAIVFSGQIKHFTADLKSLAKAFLFFCVGAAPIIAYAAISDNIFHYFVFNAHRGAVPGDTSAAASSLFKRLDMIRRFYTPALELSVGAWAVYSVAVGKIDRHIKFLFIFFLAFTALSIVTHSGLYEHHLLVSIPAGALIIGAVAHIPVKHFPSSGGAIAATVVIIVCIAGFRIEKAPGFIYPQATDSERRAFSQALSRADASHTIASQKDITALMDYQEYLDSGRLQPVEQYGVVSTKCNRFRSCPPLKRNFALDQLFTVYLEGDPEAAKCLNTSRYSFFDTPDCDRRFRDLMLYMADVENFSDAIMCYENSPNDTLSGMGEFFRKQISMMESARELSISSEPLKSRHFNCELLKIKPTGARKSPLKSLTIMNEAK